MLKHFQIVFILLSLLGCGKHNYSYKPVNCALSKNNKGIEGAFVIYPKNLKTYNYKYLVLRPVSDKVTDKYLKNFTKVNFLITHLNKNSFLSLYSESHWWEKGLYANSKYIDRQKKLIDKIYSTFKNNIAGIYIPQEMDVCGHSSQLNNYYTILYNYAHKYHYKVMLAPYWTHCSLGNFQYGINQIQNSADIIAIQDGVGVRQIKNLNYLKPYLKTYYCMLNNKAWIVAEAFNSVKDMGTTIYQDPKLMLRVKNQIKIDREYAKHIIVFSNLNLLKNGAR